MTGTAERPPQFGTDAEVNARGGRRAGSSEAVQGGVNGARIRTLCGK